MEKDIHLSILICSITSRTENFLSRLLKQLEPQLTPEVEVMVYTDNMTITIGKKRNRMIEMAQGEYVVFIDDDDRISEDYVSSLLEAIKTKPDVVTFNAMYNHNGGEYEKPVVYSLGLHSDYNTPECYYRLPNGLSCWNRHLIDGMFEDISWQEDSIFSKVMNKRASSEVHIDKCLYFYDYSVSTSTSSIYNVRPGQNN